MTSFGLRFLAALVFTLFSGFVQAAAPPKTLHHDLQIRLHLSEQRLAGTDRVTVDLPPAAAVSFFLSERARILSVRTGGEDLPYRLDRDRLKVSLPSGLRARPFTLEVNYTVVFDDPVPETIIHAENPGFGVSATISESGCFLQGGSGWYPEIPGSSPSVNLEVDAPAGVVAVTAGKSLGRKTEKGRTVSTWLVREPLRRLSLSAGRYVVRQTVVNDVTVSTYFFPGSDHLSQRYRSYAARYLSLYEELFGPYPFDKFAVVENFFPTGYGFPSYTLLGGRVLRLPFIVHTSLGHEIAHCWWGNGVWVDPAGGNWSEGLTTYVADYLYRERTSPEAAREYRRQVLRDFAALAGPSEDFPLEKFRARRDPVSKVIGYGKSAMVFHMLRIRLGDAAFWGALKTVYRERLFEDTSWQDLRRAFERAAGTDLGGFFDQWLTRPGAPRLSLARVASEQTEGGWKITGELIQQPPFYDLRVELELTRGKAPQRQWLAATGHRTPFTAHMDQAPRSLAVDPDFHVFRRLFPREMPPAVNSLKGSPSVWVVLSQTLPKGMVDTARLLVRSLGLKQARMVTEQEVFEGAEKLSDHHLLIVGYPSRGALLPDLPSPVILKKGSFVLEGTPYTQPEDAFFGVFHDPSKGGRVVAVFYPLSVAAARRAATKITHYGAYSFLVFRAGNNLAKGTWPVSESPLIHRFNRSPLN